MRSADYSHSGLKRLDASLLRSVHPGGAVQNLDLSGNALESVVELRELQRNGGELVRLNIADNRIPSLDGLEGCSQLQALNCAANCIRSLEPLRTTSQLQKCIAQVNRLQHWRGLEECTQLQVLDVAQNRIDEFPSLHRLRQLKAVDLSDNNLGSLEHLVAALPSCVEMLRLASNDIAHVTELRHLRHLTRLRSLALENNPCIAQAEQDKIDVVVFLSYLCPQLRELDGLRVSRKRRATAKQLPPEVGALMQPENKRRLIVKLKQHAPIVPHMDDDDEDNDDDTVDAAQEPPRGSSGGNDSKPVVRSLAEAMQQRRGASGGGGGGDRREGGGVTRAPVPVSMAGPPASTSNGTSTVTSSVQLLASPYAAPGSLPAPVPAPAPAQAQAQAPFQAPAVLVGSPPQQASPPAAPQLVQAPMAAMPMPSLPMQMDMQQPPQVLYESPPLPTSSRLRYHFARSPVPTAMGSRSHVVAMPGRRLAASPAGPVMVAGSPSQTAPMSQPPPPPDRQAAEAHQAIRSVLAQSQTQSLSPRQPGTGGGVEVREFKKLQKQVQDMRKYFRVWVRREGRVRHGNATKIQAYFRAFRVRRDLHAVAAATYESSDERDTPLSVLLRALHKGIPDDSDEEDAGAKDEQDATAEEVAIGRRKHQALRAWQQSRQRRVEDALKRREAHLQLRQAMSSQTADNLPQLLANAVARVGAQQQQPVDVGKRESPSAAGDQTVEKVRANGVSNDVVEVLERMNGMLQIQARAITQLQRENEALRHKTEALTSRVEETEASCGSSGSGGGGSGAAAAVDTGEEKATKAERSGGNDDTDEMAALREGLEEAREERAVLQDACRELEAQLSHDAEERGRLQAALRVLWEEVSRTHAERERERDARLWRFAVQLQRLWRRRQALLGRKMSTPARRRQPRALSPSGSPMGAMPAVLAGVTAESPTVSDGSEVSFTRKQVEEQREDDDEQEDEDAAIWIEALDLTSGRVYFYHSITKQTLWAPPAGEPVLRLLQHTDDGPARAEVRPQETSPHQQHHHHQHHHQQQQQQQQQQQYMQYAQTIPEGYYGGVGGMGYADPYQQQLYHHHHQQQQQQQQQQPEQPLPTHLYMQPR